MASVTHIKKVSLLAQLKNYLWKGDTSICFLGETGWCQLCSAVQFCHTFKNGNHIVSSGSICLYPVTSEQECGGESLDLRKQPVCFPREHHSLAQSSGYKPKLFYHKINHNTCTATAQCLTRLCFQALVGQERFCGTAEGGCWVRTKPDVS